MVNVDPVNDNDPAFGQTTYTASVAEDAAIEASVTQVVATDGDSSDTADGIITYEFVAPAPSDFQVFAL